MDIVIPTGETTPTTISMKPGDVLYVVGANGTGKSSLMQSLTNANGGRVERILAHRQTWFSNTGLSLSSSNFASTQTNVRSYDSQLNTRWQDSYGGARSELVLYRLVESENHRARQIANAVDQSNDVQVQALRNADAPLPLANQLLRASNLDIRVLLDATGALMVQKGVSAPFSFAQLSDGERNALIVMASVLTAPSETLFLIDEPERHLHRSIISPLLSQLFAHRTDCYFIVATHEIALPLDTPTARTLLIRQVVFQGESPASWTLDVLEGGTIDDEVKRDILGQRRTVLFVEGEQRSLDVALYHILFPDVSVVQKGSCKEVEQAVRGVRGADDLHWIRAFGIVDNDHRPVEDITRLRAAGIFPLSVYAVESIYYHPDVIRLMARRLGSVQGFDVPQAVEGALTSILGAVQHQAQRLAVLVAERQAREYVLRHLPTTEAVSDGTPVDIQLDTAALVAEERTRLDALVAGRDVAALVARYRIRDTPAFKRVAQALGLTDRASYEQAVRTMLLVSPEARELVYQMIPELVAALQMVQRSVPVVTPSA